MRKIQLILLGLITIICLVVKVYSNGSTSFSKGEDFSYNTPNSSNEADSENTDDAAKAEDNDANIDASNASSPIPEVDSMTYDAKSFTLNKSYNFLLTLSEKTKTDQDRNYLVHVYAGSDKVGEGEIAINQGEEVAKTKIPVTFTKANTFRTNIKIFDKATNVKVLDKNGTTERQASNRITSDKELFGLDHFATKSLSTYQSFKKNGVDFIARYYSENDKKCITQDEAKDITAAGMQIVTVYQDRGDNPADYTHDNGVKHGNNAIEHAKRLGQPVTTPIYFAVDIEAKGEALNKVQDYFQGINDAMNSYKSNNNEYWQIGVYGSYYVVSHIQNANLATYAWQTSSWSYGNIYEKNNIYQKDVNSSFMGVSVDKNVSNSATDNDVGGFQIN